MLSKPNVILIGIDTLRYDHLGFAGYNRKTSPNIDSLASDSVVFKNCFSQAPNTSPSFMSLMTSLYPTYHGITDVMNPIMDKGYRSYALDPKITTFAQVLKQNGYRTAAFTGGANLYNKIGFGRGFDYYDMNLRRFELKKEIFTDPIPKSEIFYWLRENRENPFFLFFHTFSVHNPWTVPEKYANLFGGMDDEIMAKLISDSSIKKADGLSLYNRVVQSLEKNKGMDSGAYQALYDGAIKYADDFVGEFIMLLENLKLLNNSLIILMSDHGEEFFDHERFGHKQLYNELLHVPLIMRIPVNGMRCSIAQTVRLIDVMPTVLEILNINAGIPMQGVSLLKAMSEDLNLTAIAESEIIGYSAQNSIYKYIYPRKNAYTKRVDELYDTGKDPQEKNNIALLHLDITAKMFNEYEKENHVNDPKLPLRELFHAMRSSGSV